MREENRVTLLPSKILPRLRTRTFGKKIHDFPVTASTNNEAIRRAKEGGEEGEVFIAERQTSGRGRMGRGWESAGGKDLILSILLRPSVPPSGAPLVTLVAGVAAFDAVFPLLPDPDPLKFKWPNDLYYGDRKMAGILTEMEAEAERVRFVVCGIGMNLNSAISDFSPEVGVTATSLKVVLGRPVDREEVTVRLIESFERRYCQFLHGEGSLLVKFADEHSYLRGKRVRLDEGGRTVKGVATGLSPEGYLLVRTDVGETRTVISGDVSPEAMC